MLIVIIVLSILYINSVISSRKLIKGCEERGDKNIPYMTRYYLINSKLFQLCIHIFHRSDADDFHDHPWRFISLILWRGYIEETFISKKRVYPGMILLRKANHIHRVELVKGKKAITLVFMGKYTRQWGFYVKEVFIQWQKYFKQNGC